MANGPVDTAGAIERDFQQLLAIADGLGPKAEADGWTVKDVIAHVAAWDREMLTALNETLAGRPAHYVSWNEDEYNETIIQRSRSISWAGIREDAITQNASLCAAIRAIAEDAWQRPAAGRWMNGTPVTPASVVGYTYRGSTHYGGHARELAAVRGPHANR